MSSVTSVSYRLELNYTMGWFHAFLELLALGSIFMRHFRTQKRLKNVKHSMRHRHRSVTSFDFNFCITMMNPIHAQSRAFEQVDQGLASGNQISDGKFTFLKKGNSSSFNYRERIKPSSSASLRRSCKAKRFWSK